MIGKPEWFQRRKYGGWGISPRTWQGWVYAALILVPFIIFQSLPYWSNETRLLVTGLWIAFLLVDVTHIMVTLRRDEREHKIESIAERNAAWFMVTVLVIGIVYQIISSALRDSLEVNWFMVVALFGGAIIKTISNVVLEKKKL
jgi:FtsH-binding integral membrane protein